jgi:TolB-like protein
MSFFTELKRRNVFRVGIAYLIGAWLLLQIADVVLNNISAPDWVFKTIMLLVGIGLPIALFFAWAFELTPDGVKRESEVDRSKSIRKKTGQKLNRSIIMILVVALAYFVWESRFTREAESPSTNKPDSQITTNVIPAKAGIHFDTAQSTEQSVAVLPFVNMSSDPEQEYFSDGITEEIINALVKIPGLSVPARTSVFGFKGQQGDVRKIGQQLGVAHVLEGSIRTQGNQVRITAQLIKVDDGFHLWSETFDRQLDNIFAVQEEIATAIARVLTGELGLNVVTVPNQTRNMAAYDSYLQGRALLHKRGMDNLDQAVELFTQSTTLDPDFAPAWAAMALTYTVMELSPDLLAQAISTARHALSLDPDNVDALDALASALRDSWQWGEAETYFNQAMAIDPQSSELLEDYAEFLGSVGRFDEYLSVSEQGYLIDPLLGPLTDAHMSALMVDGQYTRAIEVIDHWNAAVRRGDIPTYWYAPYWKVEPLLASGDTAAAIAMIDSLGPQHLDGQTKTAAITLLENPTDAQAQKLLRSTFGNKSESTQWTDIRMAQLVLAHTGDTDYVIDTDISSFKEFRYGNREIIWSPVYAQVRQHPRFEEYLELLNLPQYWDQAGWPNACQRAANGRIKCQ